MDKFVTSLREDFQRANDSVNKVLMGEERGLTEDQLLTREVQSVVQRQPMLHDQLFVIEDPILINRIQQHRDNPEMLKEILKPSIDEKIVKPRFKSFKEFWTDSIVTQVNSANNSILSTIKNLQQHNPEYNQSWLEIKTNVEEIRDYINKFEITPPSDPYWWSTVRGKIDFAINLTESVEHQLQLTRVIYDISEKIKQSLKEYTILSQKLDEELNKINTSFKEQQEQLSSIIGPFKLVALDLKSTITKFPIMLALCIMILTIWVAQKMGELLAVMRLIEDDTKFYLHWLGQKLAFGVLPGSSLMLRREDPKHVNKKRINLLGLLIVRIIILVAWISIATIELRGWFEVSEQSLLFYFFLSFIVVVLSHSMLWKIQQTYINIFN